MFLYFFFFFLFFLLFSMLFSIFLSCSIFSIFLAILNISQFSADKEKDHGGVCVDAAASEWKKIRKNKSGACTVGHVIGACHKCYYPLNTPGWANIAAVVVRLNPWKLESRIHHFGDNSSVNVCGLTRGLVLKSSCNFTIGAAWDISASWCGFMEVDQRRYFWENQSILLYQKNPLNISTQLI